MEQLQQQHHVEDVGRILLHTQDQLRRLREQLSAQTNPAGSANGGGGLLHGANALLSNNAGAEIEEILQRAENELRMKAELVLGNLVASGPAAASATQSSDRSLPSVRQPHGVSPSSTRRRRRRGPLELSDRDDDDASELDLNYFRQRFKPNTVSSLLASDSPMGPARRGGGLSVANHNGRLITRKTTTNARLLPYLHKYDPAAPRPVLSPVDAQQGVLSLLNRGFLPPNVDLTPAFQGGTAQDDGVSRGGGVIQNGAVRLYRREEQPVRAVPYANPTNFNLATLKFDMAATNVAISNARDISPPPPQRQLNTVTISFTDGESPPQQSTDEPEMDEPPPQLDSEPAQHIDDADASESDANAMDDLRKNVEKIRGYNELLDTYSLHQFIIHKGRAMRETPEFQSFKRVGQEIWGAVDEVIRALEALLTRYFVPLAYIDGQRLMVVAAMEMASFPTSVLLSCVVNEDQVASLLRRPGQRYKGKDRKRRAATTLQAFFRMLFHRNRFRRVCRRGASATRIQTTWRKFAAQQSLRRELTLRRAEQLRAWQLQMARLRSQWREISTQRRVVVHVPSLSLDEHARVSLDHFAVQQNLQLARLAAVVDATVEYVVYVSPFELPTDLSQYVVKLLQLSGVANAAHRVKIVVPEHAATFPGHFSLATQLLYSPHCLRRIKRLVRGKEAYLVMGVPGDDDQRLALTLELPLLGFSDPREARPLLTRAGAKRLFLKADVNVPTGTYDLYDVDELLFALAKLIISHLDQNVWVLRLDAHDVRATGTALLDVSALTTLREIRRAHKPPAYWKQPGIRDTVARALLQELERDIGTLAKPCHSERFPDWRAFAQAIGRDGVVIEALPARVRGVVRVNFFVSPASSDHAADVPVVSTQEALRASAGRAPLAFACPQTLVPHDAVVGAAQAIGRLLREDYAFCGYASVDLQLCRDETSSLPVERLWAVALYPYLTDSAAAFATFHALHGGAVDATSGLYLLPSPAADTSASLSAATPLVLQEAHLLARASRPLASPSASPRCFVSVDWAVHPNLCTMPTPAFFLACRRHGVCFDVTHRVGSVFMLPDSLTAGVFGVWSSGESPLQAMQYLRTAFEVLAREVGSSTSSSDGNFGDVLVLLRHRVGVEKEREKEATSVRSQQPPPPPAIAETTPATGAVVTPLLRVGKADTLRRLRRGSQ